MKKLKNGCCFVNIDCMEKFQITDTPKVWVSSFLSVDGNGISPLAIMKKLKHGCHFVNIDHMEKFQITDPLKVWVSGFPSVDRNGISPSVIMKKLKHGCQTLGGGVGNLKFFRTININEMAVIFQFFHNGRQ